MDLIRHAVFLCAVVASQVLAAGALAVSLAEIRSVAQTTAVSPKELKELSLHCPVGNVLVSHTTTVGRPESMFVTAQRPLLIDGTTPTTEGVYGAPAGVSVTAFNNGDFDSLLNVEVVCDPGGTLFGNTAAHAVSIPTKGTVSDFAECPSGKIATGGGYDASNVLPHGTHPDWSIGPRLAARADGAYDAANAWGAEFANPASSDRLAMTFAYCHDKPPGATTFVASYTLDPGERRFLGLARANDDYIVTAGAALPFTARYLSDGAWRYGPAPTSATGFNFTRFSGEYRPGGGGVAGAIVLDLQPPSPLPLTGALPRAGSLVKLAITAMPNGEALRPANVVTAVEYYNAARDHYFITTIPQEISDLDTGVHPGWTRTQQSFSVYAAASGGPLGRLPMCRYYGLPEAGLDSHFYTASALECLDVLAKFAGAWQIESGEVFQVQLPNVATGECPAGTTPVLRTWNQRPDSNHRYTTNVALRNQMLAQGHVAEGYGPNGVAFCTPS